MAVDILDYKAQGWKIVQKMNSLPRGKALRGTMKLWGQSFSQGHYPSLYQQAGKVFFYVITLWSISQDERTQIVPAYFVDFYIFLGIELSTSFFISLALASAKWSFPWPIKIKSDNRYQIWQRIFSDNHCPILYHVISFIPWEPAEINRWVTMIYIKDTGTWKSCMLTMGWHEVWSVWYYQCFFDATYAVMRNA